MLNRKLSLHFLVWVIQREEAQLGPLDSIEHLYTTLRLFKKHLEYSKTGVLEFMLKFRYQLPI